MRVSVSARNALVDGQSLTSLIDSLVDDHGSLGCFADELLELQSGQVKRVRGFLRFPEGTSSGRTPVSRRLATRRGALQ